VRVFALLLVVPLGGCMEPTLTSRPDQVDEPDAEVPEDPGVDVVLPPGTPVGGVRGRFCEAVDQPLVGAFVQIEHEFGVHKTTTNAEGWFELTGVPVGRHVVVVTHNRLQEIASVDVPEGSFAEVQGERCEDPCEFSAPCVGLAEAVDRGRARIWYTGMGDVRIENLSATNGICLDPWMVFFSVESQDAMVGLDPGMKLMPGEFHDFPYAVDVYGGEGREAWWCVEREQMTQGGAEYQYNGSLAPYMLMRWVEDRTDEDFDTIEDHLDWDEEGQVQTQRNVWRDESEQPIVLIGRDHNVVRLLHKDDRQEVILQAKNLGRQPATAEVYERVPAGFVVHYTTPAAQVQPQSDGTTLLIWQVSLDGAQPVEGRHTKYDVEEVRYIVGRGDTTCRGRCPGNGASTSWVDRMRVRWRADSEPIIYEVCPDK
jgi:hypothetical protein